MPRTDVPKTVHNYLTPIMRRFRAARMRQFAAMCHVRPDSRVLDVGGTPFNWELSPVRPQVTLLNVEDPNYDLPSDMRFVRGDGCALQFGTGEFDIVYSNSVIEHVSTLERQRQFADECARVGRSYYVQTPNRYFPLEPHLVTPFVHWLPRAWQRPLIRNGTVWGLVRRPDAAATAWYDDVRLLTASELRQLFPGATIVAEHFMGLTKSLIAIRAVS